MISYVKRLTDNKFIRNVAVVATGTAGAQAITMVFSPIITRIYGPEAFGFLGTFMAIMAVLTPMAALTYPIAIVLPKNDDDARGLAKLSTLLALGVSLISAVLILIWGDRIAGWLSAEKISSYFLLIPVAIFFSAIHQILSQLLIRHKKFNLTARVAVIQSVVLNTAKAGLGLFYPFAVVLIVLQAIASFLHATLLWLGMRKSQDAHVNITKTSASLKRLAYRYRDFAYFRTPEVTINEISQSLPVLMLVTLFGPEAAGFYALARTVMGIPISLIGKSVGDVLYPRLSEAAASREALYPLIRNATLLLAAVGFAPFATVMIFGPWLFSFVFGNEWMIAGEYARWIAVWLFFVLMNVPSIKAMAVLKAQAHLLAFTSIMMIVNFLALFFGYYFFESELVAVAFFGVSGALLNLILIGFVAVKSKTFDATPIV